MTGEQHFDPIAAWQNASDTAAPSLEEISSRAQRFQAKARRNAIIFSVAFVVYVAISLGEDLAGIEGSLWWVGVIRYALFLTWVLYMPFRVGSIDESSLAFLRLSGTTPVLDFYRRQLQRQRDFFRDNSQRMVQFVAIVFGTTIYCVVYPRLFLVFAVPIIVASVLIYQRRRTELPQIQTELEALDKMPR